ncbi:MAG: MmgE/PrpD family protein, partial [Sandaracinaceae bacterium]|nr:MmgE/PrpD family protein [Sandaracinaceae bacterium]
MGAFEEMAEWAMGLRASDVPPDVLERARAQAMATVAAVHAGAAHPAAAQARDVALALGTRGACTLAGSDERVAPIAALLADASASMAHDFDDYLFLGHTGHSAVLAPIAIGEETNASMSDALVAQVAANEIAGRLGAFVSVGPQNGQLWAHIHLAGAVVAAARLRGLDALTCAHALAIAFYQPGFSLWPGFMGSEAKVLTAAWPCAQGVLATDLAMRGMKGALGLLEHPQGFGRHFSFLPLPQLLGGLGDAWVTRSLSLKPYPGCAYTTAPVQATLLACGSRRLEAREVARVRVMASALTTGMESLCDRSVPPSSLDPIAINFSARRSIAVAIMAGKLGPAEMSEAWIAPRASDLAQLARRVELGEDRAMTIGVLQGIARAVPLGALAREVGLREAARGARRLIAHHGAAFRDPLGRARGASLAGVGELIAPFLSRERFDPRAIRFEELAFRFAAEVEIELTSGERLHARVDRPRGAAGGSVE